MARSYTYALKTQQAPAFTVALILHALSHATYLPRTHSYLAYIDNCTRGTPIHEHVRPLSFTCLALYRHCLLSVSVLVPLCGIFFKDFHGDPRRGASDTETDAVLAARSALASRSITETLD
eukprot:5432206-Pleurochrysis_carterae.AAC.1